MKKSNIILLVSVISLFTILLIPVFNKVGYVSQAAYIEQNNKGLKDLNVEMYNYATVLLKSSYDTVLLRSNTGYDKQILIRWVESEKFGFKHNFIIAPDRTLYELKGKTLYINVDPQEGKEIILYGYQPENIFVKHCSATLSLSNFKGSVNLKLSDSASFILAPSLEQSERLSFNVKLDNGAFCKLSEKNLDKVIVEAKRSRLDINFRKINELEFIGDEFSSLAINADGNIKENVEINSLKIPNAVQRIEAPYGFSVKSKSVKIDDYVRLDMPFQTIREVQTL